MNLLHRVIVVSRRPDIQELARQICNEVFIADDLVETLDIAETVNPDLALIDDSILPDHIHEFRDAADKSSIQTRIAIISSNEKQPTQNFVLAGAHYYIQDNYLARLQEIAAQIKRDSQTLSAERQLTDLFVNQFAASISMVGRSKAIRETIKMIELVASSQCNPTLILGETGTGKEVVAKAIHAIRHPSEPFVAINCAALTATLLESELFGHVKGSFTSADRDKTGLLELAGSGTVFLDEISEMPLELQAKLLRVLQEKTFRKVGGTGDITCNATIITSSNRKLPCELLANRFRQDLYYRLSICPITIPPLRSPERKDDIELLAEYFLKTSTICTNKQKKITSLTKLALEALQKHTWPGNVRELRNVIERAILLETTDKIGLSSIIIESLEDAQRPQTRDFSLEKAERELIARALQETGWQKTQAAALLGITRATLYAKVKQYNIRKGSYTISDLQSEPQVAVAG
jgi:transcriptional regulator with PAS, ATPase and Fis domain